MLEFFVNYLFILKLLSMVILVILFLFGLDDLFIDCYYWIRRVRRKFTVYSHNSHANPDDLFVPKQKPIAILIPAWQEVGVVGPMAESAAKTLDYENYQIFVGTYPNDQKTQDDVDHVCRSFEHVHKVVCALPGPTSKADCLNNIIASIKEFEKSNKFEFEGFILHDAEDMISPLELRLFNYLLDKGKDLIQVPVYPYTKHWYEFTAAHYIDEFSELHGKDVVVREAIAGQVPSAGVGTCFSRRAIVRLLREGDGTAFDTKSLTEDYDIGFRLKQWGMNEIFVRYAVEKEDASLSENRRFIHDREHRVICVREYFPSKFSLAVRQKSRWIVGIVFQGFKTHKWTKDWKVNYFLWRDRRGVIANIISFIAMVLFFQLSLLFGYEQLNSDAYKFLSVFSDSTIMQVLLISNLFMFINRLAQRMIFSTRFYGLTQGILSIFRMVWANVINFFAVLRAIKLVLSTGATKVAWDKTTHHFPHVMDASKKRIGELLLEQKLITENNLNEALFSKPPGMRLGLHLIQQNLVSTEQLAQAIATEEGLNYQRIDIFSIPPEVIAKLPASKALMHGLLPVSYDPFLDELVLAAESAPGKVTISNIERYIDANVRVVISQPGAVNAGLSHWYLRDNSVEQHVAQLSLSEDTDKIQSDKVDRYFATRESLGQILLNMNYIKPATLRQAELDFYYQNRSERFGDLLISNGWVNQNQIDIAVNEQNRRIQNYS